VTCGKVTLLSISSTSAGPIPLPAIRAVAAADFIWATAQVPTGLLHHAPSHADVIVDAENPSAHSVMPFYDWASRGGFHITRIFSGDISEAEVHEQEDRCRELCLEFEFVRWILLMPSFRPPVGGNSASISRNSSGEV
jgi:precorrin-4 methylase